MIKITIDTSDLDSKLSALDIGAMRTAVGVGVAESARDVMAAYPPAAHKSQPFRSDKSRRFFFAALRKGQITVPYQRGNDPRSETMGRKWSIQPTNDGAQAVNAASYSDLVQGAQTQAGYHRGVWKTDEDAARQLEQDGTAEDIATRVVVKALSDAGLS